jgi:hypothetical protein
MPLKQALQHHDDAAFTHKQSRRAQKDCPAVGPLRAVRLIIFEPQFATSDGRLVQFLHVSQLGHAASYDLRFHDAKNPYAAS